MARPDAGHLKLQPDWDGPRRLHLGENRKSSTEGQTDANDPIGHGTFTAKFSKIGYRPLAI